MDNAAGKKAWARLLEDVNSGGHAFSDKQGVPRTTSGHGYRMQESYELTARGKTMICSRLPARFSRYTN